MLLWLDDLRVAPPGWTWALNASEAQALVEANLGQIQLMSLDHDLGDEELVGSGYTFLLWLAEQAHGPRGESRVWPTEGLRVHSDNGVGVERMLGLAERYGPWPRRIGRCLGQFPPGVPVNLPASR